MTSEVPAVGRRFAAIVGAPRCGTTSLSRYLETHPDVDFSVVKEPHFFSQFDLTGLGDAELLDRIEQDYLARFFPDVDPAQGHTLMDGSVTYLYAAGQMVPILRAWPDAKFIIAVRDPFAMLPSLHQRLRFLGDEDEPDFEQAWALAAEREQGRHIPPTCIEARWLLYPEIGRLGKYVEQFMQAVGPDRCLVMVFDDLAADPGAEYRRVLSFLGLPDDGRTDFSAQRASKGYKIAWLQRLLKRPPKRVRSVMAGEKFRQRVKAIDGPRREPWLIRTILRLRKRLLRWNEAPPPAMHLSDDMKAKLNAALADDVAHLARLLDRDLSHWLGGVPQAKPDHRLQRETAASVA